MPVLTAIFVEPIFRELTFREPTFEEPNFKVLSLIVTTLQWLGHKTQLALFRLSHTLL